MRLSGSVVREPDVCVHRDPGDLETIMDAGDIMLLDRLPPGAVALDVGAASGRTRSRSSDAGHPQGQPRRPVVS